jgi:ABC-type lipoprotein release transport system permease subunit
VHSFDHTAYDVTIGEQLARAVGVMTEHHLSVVLLDDVIGRGLGVDVTLAVLAQFVVLDVHFL